MNKCIFSGRLTSDVDLRETESTAIAKFRMAVKRQYKRKDDPDADFINLTAFGNTAINISKFFGKGSMILVDTRMQTGSYEKKDGTKVYTTDFIVNSFDFLESRKKDTEEDREEERKGDTGFMPVPDDEDLDLPFR